MNRKHTKLAASVLAFCLAAAPVFSQESIFGKNGLISGITASAASYYREGDFQYMVTDQGNRFLVIITNYYGSASSLVIPSKLGGKYVTGIRGSAFADTPVETISFASDSQICLNGEFPGIANMEGLKTITLPSNCTEIKENAFYGCTNLTTVNLTGSLQKIGEHAFENCTALRNITLTGGTVIESYAFKNCMTLYNFRFPRGSVVKARAFEGSKLTNIIIPSDYQAQDLAGFDEDAFSGCNYLERINYDNPYVIDRNTTEPTLNPSLGTIITALFGHSDEIKWVSDYMNCKAAYIVRSIRQQNPGIGDVQLAVKLNDWICDNASYNSDGPVADYQSAATVFLLGESVCAGYAGAYNRLLTAAGIENRTISQAKHVWNQAKLNGTWFNIDTTWNDNTNSYRYFMESDAERAASTQYSQWNNYGLCTTRMGDLNGDHLINSTDAQLLRRHLLGYSNQIPNARLYLADMDFDGSVTTFDLNKLNQKILNQ